MRNTTGNNKMVIMNHATDIGPTLKANVNDITVTRKKVAWHWTTQYCTVYGLTNNDERERGTNVFINTNKPSTLRTEGYGITN